MGKFSFKFTSFVLFVDNKRKRDSNEGIEDVADLVEDALQHKRDGDSDSSSVSSTTIDDAIKRDGKVPNAHLDITDEIASPDHAEPALRSHILSDSGEGHVMRNSDHVTTMSVGGGGDMEPRIERQESIEKARHASNREDPRLSLRMDEEITLGQEEIMYVLLFLYFAIVTPSFAVFVGINIVV